MREECEEVCVIVLCLLLIVFCFLFFLSAFLRCLFSFLFLFCFFFSSRAASVTLTDNEKTLKAYGISPNAELRIRLNASGAADAFEHMQGGKGGIEHGFKGTALSGAHPASSNLPAPTPIVSASASPPLHSAGAPGDAAAAAAASSSSSSTPPVFHAATQSAPVLPSATVPACANFDPTPVAALPPPLPPGSPTYSASDSHGDADGDEADPMEEDAAVVQLGDEDLDRHDVGSHPAAAAASAGGAMPPLVDVTDEHDPDVVMLSSDNAAAAAAAAAVPFSSPPSHSTSKVAHEIPILPSMTAAAVREAVDQQQRADAAKASAAAAAASAEEEKTESRTTERKEYVNPLHPRSPVPASPPSPAALPQQQQHHRPVEHVSVVCDERAESEGSNSGSSTPASILPLVAEPAKRKSKRPSTRH